MEKRGGDHLLEVNVWIGLQRSELMAGEVYKDLRSYDGLTEASEHQNKILLISSSRILMSSNFCKLFLTNLLVLRNGIDWALPLFLKKNPCR